MFPEKERSWLTGPFSTFNYPSWAEWIYNRPYEYLWKGHKLILWNIQEKDGQWWVQLLYLSPRTTLDICSAEIKVALADEPKIREWLDKQKRPF